MSADGRSSWPPQRRQRQSGSIDQLGRTAALAPAYGVDKTRKNAIQFFDGFAQFLVVDLGGRVRHQGRKIMIH